MENNPVRISDLRPHLVLRMVGERPPENFISDGCSCSPDIVRGADLRTACHWHDWAYRKGFGTEGLRLNADLDFYDNLKACGLSTWTALRYYYKVRFWGHYSYKYSKESLPHRNPRFWAKLFFSRYVQW